MSFYNWITKFKSQNVPGRSLSNNPKRKWVSEQITVYRPNNIVLKTFNFFFLFCLIIEHRISVQLNQCNILNLRIYIGVNYELSNIYLDEISKKKKTGCNFSFKTMIGNTISPRVNMGKYAKIFQINYFPYHINQIFINTSFEPKKRLRLLDHFDSEQRK